MLEQATVDPNAAVAVLGSVLLSMVGLLVWLIKQQRSANATADETLSAVNGVGPGEHRLYQRVAMIASDVEQLVDTQKQFRDLGWQNLPDGRDGTPALHDAVQLTQTISSLQQAERDNRAAHAQLLDGIDQINRRLTDHDQWERSVKWPHEPGNEHNRDEH